MSQENVQHPEQTAENQGAGQFRLPRQAQENANKAEELLAHLNGGDQNAAAAAPASDTVQPAAEAPAATTQGVETQPAAAAAASDTAPAAASPAAPATGEPEVIDWEARALTAETENTRLNSAHNTLQGKYDTEVPRMQNEMRDFKTDISGKIDLLTKANPVVEEPVAAPWLDKLKETYDGDMIDGIVNGLREEFGTAIDNKVAPVADRVASAEDTLTNERVVEFNSAMDTTVAQEHNWRELFAGNNPAFNAFLLETDASGLHTYGQLAQAYNSNFDANRMSIVVNTFLKTQGIEPVAAATTDTPAATTQPAAQPVAQPATAQPAAQAVAQPAAQPVAQPKTANIVAPQRSAPAMPAQIAETEVRIWNPTSKAQFELDDREGLYTPEQSKVLWDDLLLSSGQGRFNSR